MEIIMFSLECLFVAIMLVLAFSVHRRCKVLKISQGWALYLCDFSFLMAIAFMTRWERDNGSSNTIQAVIFLISACIAMGLLVRDLQRLYKLIKASK